MFTIYVELGIGVVLAFLLLSLLVSGINEGLNRVFAVRAKFLWAYLRDIIEGGPDEKSSRLPTRVVDVLFRLPFNMMRGGDPRPDYAPPPPPMTSTKEGVEGLYERLQAIDRPKGGRTSISQVPANRFAAAIIEMAMTPDGTVKIEQLLAKLRDANSPLYTHLNGVWLAANQQVEGFRAGVESWFDGEMQRLSRLYRRNVRWVITALSIVVTLVVGLDALEYSQALMSDQAFRTQVVAASNSNPDELSNLQAICERLEAKQGEAQSAGTSAGGQQPSQPGPFRCISAVLADPAFAQILENSLVKVNLSARGSPEYSLNGRAWWDRARSPGHWLGFLLTVVALLFGAPFWWDLLRRLTGVRSPASIASTKSG